MRTRTLLTLIAVIAVIIASSIITRLIVASPGGGQASGGQATGTAHVSPGTAHPSVQLEATVIAEDSAKPRFYGRLGPFNIMKYVPPSYEGLSDVEKLQMASEHHATIFGLPCRYPIHGAPLTVGTPLYVPVKGFSPTTSREVTEYGVCDNGLPYNVTVHIRAEDYPDLGPMTVARFTFGKLPVNVPGWIEAPIDRLYVTSIRGRQALVEKPASVTFPTTRVVVIEREPSETSYGIVMLLVIDSALEDALARADKMISLVVH